MTFWRMQLHPGESGSAIKHAVESLVAGHIGLDFERDVGDLKSISKSSLPENQKDYWAFAHEMEVGDKVLIIVHHFPFALATVSGEYNYIRVRAPELKVWFRHFRRVEDVLYYADVVTDVRKWEQLKMTDTISPLRRQDTMSYKLIAGWSGEP